MNPWNEFMDQEELEDLKISDHFFVELAEKFNRIVYPDMTEKDSADLINQMTLVSLEDAAQLKEWYEQ